MSIRHWMRIALTVAVSTLVTSEAVAQVDIGIVTLPVQSASDVAATLPASETLYAQGETFFLEVWAQTAAPEGFAQVSVDINFDAAVMSGVSITHTALFSLFPNGTIDNATGTVNDLSGSHPPASPPCSDQVGVAPNWVRVAAVEMHADAVGNATLQAAAADSLVFVVANCGSAVPPTVTYGGANVTVTGCGDDPCAVNVVAVAAPSVVDVAASLPLSEPEFIIGSTFFLEIWAQTGSPNGYAQVVADIGFNPGVLSGVQITQTAMFNLFPSGTIDNGVGLVDNAGGAHPPASPPCGDQVGFAPNWVRAAVIEMHADAVGAANIQALDSGDPINVVALCNSFVLPPVAYGAVPVIVVPAPPQLPASPHDIRKNRFISINPNNAAVAVSLRVELLDLACSTTSQKCNNAADCRACDSGIDAGSPCTINSDCTSPGLCLLSGETCLEQSPPVLLGWVGDPAEAGNSAPAGTLTSLVVSTQPATRTWTEPVVHIAGCAIAPHHTYAIIATSDGVQFSDRLVVGTIVRPQDKDWADLVGSFDGVTWSPPNGLVGVDDVGAMIKFITQKIAPHITVVDLAGSAPRYVNFLINATDLQLVIQGFKGRIFPPVADVLDGYPADGDVTSCP